MNEHYPVIDFAEALCYSVDTQLSVHLASLLSTRPEEDVPQTAAVSSNSGVTTLQGANASRHENTVQEVVLFPCRRLGSYLPVRPVMSGQPLVTRNLPNGRRGLATDISFSLIVVSKNKAIPVTGRGGL
jgi:hypothetical protein